MAIRRILFAVALLVSAITAVAQDCQENQPPLGLSQSSNAAPPKVGWKIRDNLYGAWVTTVDLKAVSATQPQQKTATALAQ
jgi:hypothetical protein